MKFDNTLENGKNRIFVSSEAMKDCDCAIGFSQKNSAEICGLGTGYSDKSDFFIVKYHLPQKILFVDSREEMQLRSIDTDAELITVRKDSQDKNLSCILTESYVSRFKREDILCSGHTHFPEEMPRPSPADIMNIHYPHNHELSITSLFQIGSGLVFFGFPSYMLDAMHDQDTIIDSAIDDWLLHNYDGFVFRKKNKR